MKYVYVIEVRVQIESKVCEKDCISHRDYCEHCCHTGCDSVCPGRILCTQVQESQKMAASVSISRSVNFRHISLGSSFKCWNRFGSWRVRHKVDIVGTVYHLVIYMQSNKVHKVILMSEFIYHVC